MAASVTPCGSKGAKKRKVSSTKDSEASKTGAPGSKQEPDIKDKASVYCDTGQQCVCVFFFPKRFRLLFILIGYQMAIPVGA